MKREQILAILYEMAIVIGGEIRLDQLLTRTLQRLLFHTSFPCGMVFLDTEQILSPGYCQEFSDVRLETSIGDSELGALNKKIIHIPTALLRGGFELTENPQLLGFLPCRKDYYKVFLRLPIDDSGVILLLASRMPETSLPLTSIFQPVLSNFAKAILLCRSNDAYTQSIITDRRMAEAALQDLSARNRLILDSVGEGICGLDRDGNTTFVNPAAARMLGFSQEELVGHSLHEMLYHRRPNGSPEPLEECPITRTIAENRQFRISEDIFQRADGTSFPVEYVSTPLREDDNVMGAVIVFRDISERKRAEEDLRRLNEELEQRVRVRTAELKNKNEELKNEINERRRMEGALRLVQFAVDHASDCIFWIKPDARFANVNDSTCRRLGYARDELLNLSVFDVDPAFPREAWEAHWQDIKKRKSFTIETSHRTKDGEVFPVEATVNYVEYGGAEYNFAFARDISVRKWAEEALAREREFSRALLDSMADGVVACDAEGTLTLFNRTAREWHGMDPLKLPPEKWAEHYDLFRLDGITQLPTEEIPLARAFRGEIVTDAGMAIVARGQTARFILANGSLIRDENGTKLGAVVVMRDVTEIRRIEEELRKANEELERRVIERTKEIQRRKDELDRFFNVALDLLCVADTDGFFRLLNITWEKTLGYTRDELMEKRFLDFIHPKDLPATLEALTALASQQEVLNFVNRYRCKDGTYRWFEWRATPVGELIYAAARDITERRRMEEALEKSEQRLQLHFMQTPLAVIEWDTGFHVISWNPAAEKIFGYTATEALGRHAEFIVPVSARPHVDRIWGDLLLREGGERSTNENVTKDGMAILCEWYNTPLVTADGRVIGVASLVQDVTERKRAEEELRSERRLFVGGPTVVFKWKAQEGWPVEYVSPNVADQFGYTPEDFTSGKLQYAAIVHPDDLSRLAAEVSAYSEQGVASFEQIYRITHSDGRYRWIDDFTTVIRDIDGTITHYLGYVLDITERKNAEDEIRRSLREWSAAMDASEDVIYLLDLDSRVIRANKAFYMMTRSTPEAAIGRHIVELVHPAGEKVPCPICLAQEEVRDLVLTMETDHPHNPSGRPIEITLRIVRDDEERPISMFMTLHDLTHERKVQEELTKYREHLEELVKTRTEEIEKKNAELERMNKIFVGRELRMIELKERIKTLENKRQKS